MIDFMSPNGYSTGSCNVKKKSPKNKAVQSNSFWHNNIFSKMFTPYLNTN